MKTYAARKIDFVFLTLALGLIFFIVYRYLLKSALYGGGAAALTLAVFYLVYFKVKGKSNVTAEDSALIEKIFFNLQYLPGDKINSFITELFNKAEYQITESGGAFLAQKQGKKYATAAVFNKNAGAGDVYKCFYHMKTNNCDGIFLLCGEADKSAHYAMSSTNAENCHIIEKQSLFSAMKKYGVFPQCEMEPKRPRKRFKEFLSKAFERKKFKGYFFIGVIMFLFSFISPFKTYYLAACVVLFAFSALSLTLGKKTKKSGDVL